MREVFGRDEAIERPGRQAYDIAGVEGDCPQSFAMGAVLEAGKTGEHEERGGHTSRRDPRAAPSGLDADELADVRCLADREGHLLTPRRRLPRGAVETRTVAIDELF